MNGQFPHPLVANEATRAGRMLASGDVRVTITSSRTGQHITVRFKAFKDNREKDGYRPMPEHDRNWVRVPLADATHVFMEVPSASGDFPDKIATYYPRTGRFYKDRNADEHRVWAAMAAASWLTDDMQHPRWNYRAQATYQEESYCGVCGRTLTDPVSIDRGIGPMCLGQATGSHHEQKSMSRVRRSNLASRRQTMPEVLSRSPEDTSGTAQPSVESDTSEDQSARPRSSSEEVFSSGPDVSSMQEGAGSRSTSSRRRSDQQQAEQRSARVSKVPHEDRRAHDGMTPQTAAVLDLILAFDNEQIELVHHQLTMWLDADAAGQRHTREQRR